MELIGTVEGEGDRPYLQRTKIRGRWFDSRRETRTPSASVAARLLLTTSRPAAARRAGVPIALGTDRVPGGDVVAIVEEAAALQRHGFSEVEVLRAATSGGAQALGLTDRGVATAGARADLVVVEGDLSTDLSGLGKPRHVIKAGQSPHLIAPEAGSTSQK